jgi:hypothetical protein
MASQHPKTPEPPLSRATLSPDEEYDSDEDHPLQLHHSSHLHREPLAHSAFGEHISDSQTQENLERVSGALQEMKDEDLAADVDGLPVVVVNAPMSPGIPPVAFGAGGPM